MRRIRTASVRGGLVDCVSLRYWPSSLTERAIFGSSYGTILPAVDAKDVRGRSITFLEDSVSRTGQPMCTAFDSSDSAASAGARSYPSRPPLLLFACVRPSYPVPGGCRVVFGLRHDRALGIPSDEASRSMKRVTRASPSAAPRAAHHAHPDTRARPRPVQGGPESTGSTAPLDANPAPAPVTTTLDPQVPFALSLSRSRCPHCRPASARFAACSSACPPATE